MTKVYHISLTLILAFCSISVFSQRTYETNPDRKRGFNWMFGENIWLDFKTNPPTLKSGSQLSAIESAATYSDTAGNLLYYSDGITVWNSNHKIIKNGTNLGGNHSSSQGCIFIKHPSNDSIVYLFTTDAQGGNKGFQVNTIYIKPNIDSSIIIEKNKVLLNESCESIAATQHQNGIFTWVTVHSKFGNTFYSYLINENGLVECPITSNEGYNYDGHIFNCQTTSNFSDNGNYFAINLLNDFKVQLLIFDNKTGLFKLINQFSSLNVPTGISFSNNNKYLYIVERGKQINQINLTNYQNNIVKNIDNKFLVIQIEKTPYNEIFVNILDSFYISSIKKPDLLGSNADFALRNIYLNGKTGKNGLCNFNKSFNYLPSIDFEYQLNCINNSILLIGKDTFNSNLHKWQYRKKYSLNEFVLIDNSKNTIFTFIDTGIYQVRYIAEKDNRKDTVIKTISIYPKINKNFLGIDTAFEIGKPINKIFYVPENIHCQSWYYLDTLRSNSTNYSATQKGTYICKVTNKAFCEVWDTIVINECINNLQVPSLFRSRDTLRTFHINADSFVWFRNNQFYKVTKQPYLNLKDSGTYRVEAAKKGHCNRSSEGQIIVNKLSVINISINDLNIKIYPNPNNGILNIFNSNNKTISFEITNILGQKVYTNKIINGDNLFQFNVPNGIYIISFYSHIKINHKLIIQ